MTMMIQLKFNHCLSVSQNIASNKCFCFLLHSLFEMLCCFEISSNTIIRLMAMMIRTIFRSLPWEITNICWMLILWLLPTFVTSTERDTWHCVTCTCYVLQVATRGCLLAVLLGLWVLCEVWTSSSHCGN